MRTKTEPGVRIATALLLFGLAAGGGRAQPCEMGWTSGFGVPGVDGYSSFVGVGDVAEFDDGYGPALYFVGNFDIAGSVPAVDVARWDGRSWTSTGADFFFNVWTARAFDLGNGPNLYVSGDFYREYSGREFYYVARWDGAAWHPLGPGIRTPCLDGVGALAVFDDGHGPKLYAGASTDLDVTTCDLVYRFDGDRWTPIGRFRGPLGAPLVVGSLEVFDDGSGPALYAGGLFAEVDGLFTRGGLARWDGEQWSVVGTIGVDFAVTDLEVYDDGRGEALFVAGNFTYCDEVETGPVARWDGVSWSSVGNLPSSDTARAFAYQLVPFDEPTGRVLYVTGEFNTIGGVPNGTMGRWDGTAWRGWRFDTPDGYSVLVPGLFAGDDGSGPALYMSFIDWHPIVFGLANWGVYRWRNETFEFLGDGAGFNREPLALGVAPGGGVLAAGFLRRVGDRPAAPVEHSTGGAWNSLPQWAPGVQYGRAFVTEATAEGPLVYLAGTLRHPSVAANANPVLTWDGQRWDPLGPGFTATPSSLLDGTVYALVRVPTGPAAGLYAAGAFTHAGDTLVNGVARWDGEAWHALGSGLSSTSSYDPPEAIALGVFDDGSGPALYVGGWFTHAGGVRVNSIAKWDGTQWSALGTGIITAWPGYHAVTEMLVHDDGGGPALYVNGYLGTVDGVERRYFKPIRWRNQRWEDVGEPIPALLGAMAVFDDGSGPQLWSSGAGLTADQPNGWRWDGQQWHGVPHAPAIAFKMLATEDAYGRALWFAGRGLTAGGMASARIARYGCLPPPTRGDANCDGVVSVYDIDAFVLALTDRPRYEQRFGCDRRNADVNGDGAVDNFDIDPLVERIMAAP